MTDEPLNRIVIVGGGTAGWLTALFCARLASMADAAPLSVTLIQASDIAPVGVGEATVPPLKSLFAFLGLQEREWMAACGATYKLGIRFVDWRAEPGEYWHPFFRFRGDLPVGLEEAHIWLAARERGDAVAGPLDRVCLPHIEACDRGLGPRASLDGPPALAHAYHLDAGLLASYLQERAVAAGVVRVIDRVDDVALDPESGDIASLTTQHHGAIGGDLFIDCSGFRGLLIDGALDEPFESARQHLLCDRAVAMQVPGGRGRGSIPSFTTATALRGGWAWQTPLYHRVGAGYVYSSDHISDDDAAHELRDHLGEGARDAEARHLRMRVGHRRRSWVRNCVAIGLSSGFIEPLESTGIFLIQRQLELLRTFFPDRGDNSGLRDAYNRRLGAAYREVLSFIAAHYQPSDRRDTAFWRDATAAPLPEDAAALLSRWAQDASALEPSDVFVDPIWSSLSWICVLEGLGVKPGRASRLYARLGSDSLAEALRRSAERSAGTLDELADHWELLTRARW